MPKYHINERTGRPNICKAEKGKCPVGGEHYDNKDAARAGYEQQQKEEGNTFNTVKKPSKKSSTVFSEIELAEKRKIFKKLEENGYLVSRFSDVESKFVHMSKSDKDFIVGEIRDVSGSIGFPDKPKGALWLSPMMELDGRETNAWLSWNQFEDYMDYSDSYQHDFIFDENAIVLELTDKNSGELNELIGSSIEGWDSSQGDGFFFDVQNYDKHVDWVKLKEAGVDAVRVNGSVERNHFYGWDCDSLAVLNGKSIIGSEKRKLDQ